VGARDWRRNAISSRYGAKHSVITVMSVDGAAAVGIVEAQETVGVLLAVAARMRPPRRHRAQVNGM